jgi:hypothetical protein
MNSFDNTYSFIKPVRVFIGTLQLSIRTFDTTFVTIKSPKFLT